MNASSLQAKITDADSAVKLVQSGQRLFVHGASATPTPLLAALGRRTDLQAVRLYHLHLAGEVPFFEAAAHGRFLSSSFFTGPAARKAIAAGEADFIPIFLSDIPGLFLSGQVELDVAVLQVSPPDRHGNMTLGSSCDVARAALDTARTVIVEINRQMPRTHGATVVPASRVSAAIESDRPLCEAPPAAIGPVERRIGELIADLVEDGATLQMGIGAIPDAVLAMLGNKLELGVHTEMFSDGLVPLIEGGVITNKRKAIHPGRTVTSFVTGTKRVFDFVDDNLAVEFHSCDRTNDTALIRKNERVTAINSAIEIDLSGQVCADSMGHSIYSGIGGQMDFIRGAALSRHGKPIIALPSTASGGKFSRIVAALKQGAGVVTTRGHLHWIVTEYGALNMHGKSLRERAEGLISLAHPDFRAELRREVTEVRHFDFGRS